MPLPNASDWKLDSLSYRWGLAHRIATRNRTAFASVFRDRNQGDATVTSAPRQVFFDPLLRHANLVFFHLIDD